MFGRLDGIANSSRRAMESTSSRLVKIYLGEMPVTRRERWLHWFLPPMQSESIHRSWTPIKWSTK